MTAKQVKWASQHDWFVSDLGNGTVLVRDYTPEGAQTFQQYDSYAKLRAWAGY